MDGRLPAGQALSLGSGPLRDIFEAIADEGGRALVVGGWVRDCLSGLPPNDVDVEVYGLSLPALEAVLARFGPLLAVGRAFGVLKVKGIDADFSLPRVSSLGAKARGDLATGGEPGLSPIVAARRRDLTINSMAFDPLTGELIDPLGGRADLAAGILRAADPGLFAEDPIRGLRVAELLARLGPTLNLRVDPTLMALCRRLDLGGTAPERQYDSWCKLLLRGEQPSLGLAFLEHAGLIRHFPELEALMDVPQSPLWHPEGCVWVHTLMVVDVAARLREGHADDLPLMFAALCHDLGKPATTVVRDGRIRSARHEHAGVPRTEHFLRRLSAPNRLLRQVCALVEHHLKPVQFPSACAGPAAYRRLARQLEAGEVSMTLLARVARADQLGRTTQAAGRGETPEVDRFLSCANALRISCKASPDVVQGRHLLARGFEPGPELGRILARCRDLQDRTGETTPDAILDQLLPRLPPAPTEADNDPA